jgi:hypothetical protein
MVFFMMVTEQKENPGKPQARCTQIQNSTIHSTSIFSAAAPLKPPA